MDNNTDEIETYKTADMREYQKLYQRNYRKQNKEKVVSNVLKWRRANPELYKLQKKRESLILKERFRFLNILIDDVIQE